MSPEDDAIDQMSKQAAGANKYQRKADRQGTAPWFELFIKLAIENFSDFKRLKWPPDLVYSYEALDRKEVAKLQLRHCKNTPHPEGKSRRPVMLKHGDELALIDGTTRTNVFLNDQNKPTLDIIVMQVIT